MEKRRFLGFAFCLVLCLYAAFSGMSLNASASNNVYLPYSFFQQNLPTISAQYVSSDLSYKPITFTLYAEQTFSTSVLDSSMNLYGRTYYAYRAATPNDMYVQGTAPFISYDINLSFSNVTYLNTGIATWCGQLNDNRILSYNMSSLRSNFYTQYYFNGTSSTQYLQARPDDSSRPGHIPVLNDSAIYCGWDTTFESASGTDFNFGSGSISTFWNSNGIWLAVISPLINDDYVFEGVELPPLPDSGDDWGSGDTVGEVTGTISTDANGNQNINVTVETDNTGLVGSLLNGIKRLFVPTDDELEAFSSDMSDMLQDHLGGLYEAVDLIEDQYDSFGSVTAKTELYVPETSIALLHNDTFTVGDWHISLKLSDSRFQFVYTALAFIIDFLATVAFVNMCRRKLEIFLSPESEVISDDS